MLFVHILLALFALCVMFAVALYPWVTDDDISNLPKNPVDRFLSLVYFSVTTFTSTGYGDIAPKSTRAKMVLTAYMASVFAIVLYLTRQPSRPGKT